jgi:hypothetical protein
MAISDPAADRSIRYGRMLLTPIEWNEVNQGFILIGIDPSITMEEAQELAVANELTPEETQCLMALKREWFQLKRAQGHL